MHPPCAGSGSFDRAVSSTEVIPLDDIRNRPAREPTAWGLRAAVEDDLPALVALYNHYVEHSHVTFDDTPITVDERREWFHAFGWSGPHRLLVADVAGEAVAYAESHRHRPRPGYRTTVETSIYVHPDHVRRGIGRALYGHLLACMDAEPLIHRAFAGIALPNDASVALHEDLGFRHLGTFNEVGIKYGKYWDVAWYMRPCDGLDATRR